MRCHFVVVQPIYQVTARSMTVRMRPLETAPTAETVALTPPPPLAKDEDKLEGRSSKFANLNWIYIGLNFS